MTNIDNKLQRDFSHKIFKNISMKSIEMHFKNDYVSSTSFFSKAIYTCIGKTCFSIFFLVTTSFIHTLKTSSIFLGLQNKYIYDDASIFKLFYLFCLLFLYVLIFLFSFFLFFFFLNFSRKCFPMTFWYY